MDVPTPTGIVNIAVTVIIHRLPIIAGRKPAFTTLLDGKEVKKTGVSLVIPEIISPNNRIIRNKRQKIILPRKRFLKKILRFFRLVRLSYI